ncbi:hypothetical protein [Phormidium tenue]|uniref:DUF4760 domain-containing protein n=1 Tax=Phormidium tenue NIES-30 TaxID=549789 RepID=A0A1U7J7L0_9CYAN|nr:hypothetical protein [Phormidium tenue]MBD2231453.1 hypothetical protein [Phormidium tenue FACHB-1052]OKH49155.1 hypothetical protein NIES30_08315 [Phormidium tenue NIES-30]
MSSGIEPGIFADLLMVAITFIATVANILLWFTTRATLKVLIEQVRHQFATSYSVAQGDVISAHRELFFGILNNPPLLESFTRANGLDTKAWEIEKISEFLINQVLIGYVNFKNAIISEIYFEGFKQDARSLFRYRTVCQHWARVSDVHSDDFRQFVENELLLHESVAKEKVAAPSTEEPLSSNQELLIVSHG